MTTHQRWVFAFWGYLGILLTIIISAYLKMLPVKSSTIPFYDTVGHFILIGIAAFLSHLALNKQRINYLNIALPLAPIIVSLLTLTEECLQKLSPNRSFDLMDLAADLCGIIFFTWLAEKIPDK
ncbi:VanZ family protein [Cylindrospermum sp. FACHB-282]|uniref:VanZ family protein n=1 Tax=Cylindrospermum sp. FACHB-282 TaxID=2692794 RepID=UPI001682DF5A|nr:VanZ family protein [Cylindrospermum sp. FACHB-282]MBD2388426.1 VanZ family protein [Cylindrospermum sp. FACHB-282]